MLDQRPQKMYLEQFSPWLSDFQFQKFDEVEVPGQYLQHKDSNADFIKIDRILPVVDNVRGHGISYKRLTFRGHDGSLHPFAVQYPAARHCRREERIAQLLRMFNEVLARKKESRRRNLFFSLPAAFPLSPHIRMVEDDVSYISLHQVYEDFCNRSGIHKDQAIDFYVKSVEDAMAMRTDKDTKEWLNNVRMEIIQAIRQKIVPDTFLLDFFKRTFTTFPDLWLFRKQFTLQYATIAFQTYLLAINNRYPQKFFFSRAKGNIWNTELLPCILVTK
jgi:transformation/transcription domain-associated protein